MRSGKLKFTCNVMIPTAFLYPCIYAMVQTTVIQVNINTATIHCMGTHTQAKLLIVKLIGLATISISIKISIVIGSIISLFLPTNRQTDRFVCAQYYVGLTQDHPYIHVHTFLFLCLIYRTNKATIIIIAIKRTMLPAETTPITTKNYLEYMK